MKRLTVFISVLLFVLYIFPVVASAEIISPEYVCEMNGRKYTTLSEALADTGSGDITTIRILQNIDYSGGIVVMLMTLTFDLNGFTVNINNSAADSKGLEVLAGNVNIAGEGEFNVTATQYGVYVSAGNVNIAGEGEFNVTATQYAVYVSRGCATVTNAVSQGYAGCVLGASSSLAIKGNAVSTGSAFCVAASDGGAAEVEGDVYSGSSGVFANNLGKVTVNGDIIVSDYINGLGAFSDNGSSIIIKGNVQSPGTGVHANTDNASITVDGTITAPEYIKVNDTIKTIDQYTETGTGEYADYLVYKGISSSVYVKNRPEVTPSSTTFDKNGGTDIAFTIKPYGATLAGIFNGTEALVPNTDYTVSGDTVSVLAVYLEALSQGNLVLAFDFSAGIDPDVNITIDNTTSISGIDNAYTMYVGGRLVLDPEPEGGTWDWNEDYFSATFNSPATFTALKEGTSTITYTYNGKSVYSNVTIRKSQLPQTGQNFTLEYALGGIAAIVLCIAVFLVRRRMSA